MLLFVLFNLSYALSLQAQEGAVPDTDVGLGEVGEWENARPLQLPPPRPLDRL
jgi:hypothetical protein